ncbi:MAG: class F sortase [Actinomycetota bacterium]|nr:class F sortase [Actinomycetota bacterium]
MVSVGAALLIGSLVGWQRGPALAQPPPPASTDRMGHGASRSTVTPSNRVATRAGGSPDRVIIPAIGVSAPIVDLALNPDGTLEVPPGFLEAGWYTGSSVPGEPGPAVIVGHVDSRSGPAVFYRLRELTAGATVAVRVSGEGLRPFVVTGVAEYPKSAFPTEAVYGPTSRPTLRLITCGGRFDFSTGHCVDNVVVFAVAAPAGSAGGPEIPGA